MVMSAIAVRANMRMVFDDASANKAQTSFMSRMSRIQKASTQSTNKANQELVKDHERLVARLEKSNAAADEKLKRRSKQITQQVKANAKAAMAAMDPGKYKKGGTKAAYAEYRRQAAAYKQTLKAMEGANKKYAASAKALGIQAKSGKFSLTTFSQNENAQRKQAITLMRRQVREAEKGTAQHKASLAILVQMEDAHELLTMEERMHGNVMRQNNKILREGQIRRDRGIAKNNAQLREQLRLYGQINGSISRLQMQLSGAFMNALMMSGIALMTFGFRLQSLVSTFQEFEKELMNAQSIFQTTNEVLFALSDEIVNFGTQYGISLQTASEGLYTLASAGLSASDSQEVLANTLKLSMAVQGDHDTIAKLTTQTIFGFGLQMSDSAELTDKFAHAINMSLIEYQDLASAVKFAMPFFVSTGQNVDQLLGSLQVLTNRALEAGIAGRGLRQALAEFAQHATDSEAAFRKLGVEIMDSEGNFKMLTEIAMQFKQAMGPAASDVDLMTTLLEDLNVHGATAFVHLVQNAEEFEGAVNDLQNSAGAATRMADIQQQSLANQIQVVKNALMAPFLLSDELGTATGNMNAFGESLKVMVADFEAFFLYTAPDGTKKLTEMGKALRDTAIAVLNELATLLKELLTMFANMNKEGMSLANMFHVLMLPLKALVMFINLLGDNGLQVIMMFKILNTILPLTELHTLANLVATKSMTAAQMEQIAVQRTLAGAMAIMHGSFILGIYLMNQQGKVAQNLGYALMGLAGAYAAVAVAAAAGVEARFGVKGLVAAGIAGAGLFMLLGRGVKDLMSGYGAASSAIPTMGGSANVDTSTPIYDMGGKIYDTGGLGGRHFPIMVEPGESIVSKTQNMLGGSGITLNIAGDIVTNDADDFAERIAVALPEALRRQSDMGGI